MDGLFPPVDPEAERGRPRRRLVPFTAVLPNLVTLLGLCAGLTAIRMAVEHRFDTAVAAIIVAVILDGVDGRLARYFRATSKFGEQLDSLADFVNFGVAPAHAPLRLAARRPPLLRLDLRDGARDLHWAEARALQRGADGGGGAARLAPRLLRRHPGPGRSGRGAAALLPRAGRLALRRVAAIVVAAYALVIGLLMVSRMPTLSGKRMGQRIPRDKVMPVLVLGVLLVALLASYPFSFLATGSIAYLAHLPFAWRAWNRADAHAAIPAKTETPGEDGGTG